MHTPHNIIAVECDRTGKPINPYAGSVTLYRARRIWLALELLAILATLGGATVFIALLLGLA